MKNIILFLTLIFSCLSCTSDEDMKPDGLEDSGVTVIDKNSQVYLEPTTLNKDQILDLSCGEPYATTLFAGQHIDVGSVNVINDQTNLYVSYNLTGNWWMKETHLYAGTEENIPFNGGGNPKIGHFPYHGNHGLVKNYIFTIPLADLEDCFVIISHAEVVKKENNEIVSSESAFGYGKNEFPGNRWGWYSNYCKQDCPEDCMDVFGKVTAPLNSYCFKFMDEQDKSQWTWSNEFIYKDMIAYQDQGTNYKFPLYANISESCEVDENDIIGYIEMRVHGGDGRLFTDIEYVITNSNYLLHQITLYIGTEKIPIDEEGNINENVTEDNFELILLDTPVSEYMIQFKSWPSGEEGEVFIIPHASVCLAEATHT